MSLGGSLSSTTENNAFQDAWNAGVLSIAAAGNDGSTRKSYPASYASVVSVAAVDSSKVVASFSQKNDAVELAAPGVGILSTVPFAAVDVTVDGAQYLGSNIDGSARVNATGALVDGGLCKASGSWTGKVVLCQRGDISFADKVNFVKAGGGIAAVIYNNVSGGFAGTLNATSTIPAISIAMEDGQYLVASKLGVSGTVHNATGVGSGYEAWDGTSMATPHVSGVAALVWSNFTSKTNADIRSALQQSAEDLGSAGKDNSYGYGLVRAKAAFDLLSGSAPPPPPPPADSISLTVSKVKSGKDTYALLKWSGATSTNVLVKQNGATVATTANDGEHQLGPIAKGTHTFQVCDSAGTPCSNIVSVRF
jgi:serine protease